IEYLLDKRGVPHLVEGASKLHRFSHGHPVVQRVAFGDVSDSRASLRVHRGDVLAQYFHRAAIRLHHAAEHLDGRARAGTIAVENTVDLPPLDSQVQAIDDTLRAIEFRKPLGPDDVCHEEASLLASMKAN